MKKPMIQCGGEQTELWPQLIDEWRAQTH